MNYKNRLICLFSILILFVIAVALLSPALKLPFSLIDDPNFIAKHKHAAVVASEKGLGSALAVYFVDFPGVHEGRLAQIWWLNSLRFFVVGFNPSLHHLFHASIILIILGLVFSVTFFFSKSIISAFSAAILFIILSPGFENWYRLSTQEPGQIIILLLLVGCIKSDKRSVLPVGFLSVFLIFTKEISVFLIPFFVVWRIIENKRKIQIKLEMAIVYQLISTAVLLLTLFVISKYVSTWAVVKFSAGNLMNGISSYWKLFSILFIPQLVGFSFVIFFSSRIRNTHNVIFRHVLLFLVLFACSFLPLLFWEFSLIRLTLLPKLALSIVLGMVFRIWLLEAKKSMVSRSYYWIVLLFILMAMGAKTLFINSINIYSFASDYLAREMVNGRLMAYLSDLPAGSVVVANISKNNVDAREWVEMMSKYLSSVYNRADIQVKFIDDPFESQTVLVNFSEFSGQKNTDFVSSIVFTETASSVKVSMRRAVASILKNKFRLSPELFAEREYRREVRFVGNRDSGNLK